MPDLPSQIRSALAALSGPLTPELIERTAALFAPLVARPPPERCHVTRDQPYGEDPRQVLDIFAPVREPGRPILLYVPGGGFIGGDKGGEGQPFYGNIGAWAVDHGMVGAVMNYRLAPAATWPAGAQDVATAIRWLSREAGGFGADGGRIIVMGQSAGAAHVAGYLAGHGGAVDGSVAAGIMVSGLYDIQRLTHSPREEAYSGVDPAIARAASTLDAVASIDLPLLFAVAELDPPVFQRQAALAVDAFVAARERWPSMMHMADHNHLSTTMAIGTPWDTLGPRIEAFVQTLRWRQTPE